MKKTYAMLFFFLLVCTMGFSQTRKSVSILGDSYSTFENYLQPDTNAVWYFQQPRKNNDVRSVDQTWWYKFIKESGYRLCVNNSFSGATICHTGYRKEDYSDRSFVTRMNNLGCPDLIFIFGAFGAVVIGATTVVSVLFSLFMLLIDTLVSFIQAYVFTMLSTLFIALAQVDGHHEGKVEEIK